MASNSAVAVREAGSVTPSSFNDALIKAVGWDRVPAEQRALAINICERYQLDPMLRHVVMIEGRPYVTRDALLHVAHRSGLFDGIEVTDPVLGDTHWHVKATVYRKDMSRGITYPGRYPKQGGNQKFAPEMAIKVAEVMALRRAFDVAAPVMEEGWDLDEVTVPERSAPRSLNDKLAARRADIEARNDAPATTQAPEGSPPGGTSPSDHATEPVRTTTVASVAPEPGLGQADAGEGAGASASASPSPAQCPSMSPYDNPSQCQREDGHEGNHKNRDRESW